MRVVLTEDADATRALHRSVMHLELHLEKDEKLSKNDVANTRALAFQAALAWEAIHDPEWDGLNA